MAGQCWDNAVTESFLTTIKRELTDTRSSPTWAGLHDAISDYIEGWCDTRRLHGSLGYRTPRRVRSRHPPRRRLSGDLINTAHLSVNADQLQ